MKRSCYPVLLTLALVLLHPLSAQRQEENPSDEAVRKLVPEGVVFLPNLTYREGHERWKLDLFMPAARGEEPRPAIVFVHGGGWRNGDKRRGAFLRPAIEYAAKGYVCISVNYRLREDQSVAPVENCIIDVKNAVRWLRAHAEEYNVDPDRIGATGNSAGAHLSAMLGLCPTDAGFDNEGTYQEYSSVVQAVAASATPTNFLIHMNDRLVDVNVSPELLARISPVTYASAEAPPILLFHELSDGTVDVIQADSLVAALREAGAKDVNYILLGDGTGHGVFGRNQEILEPVREAFFNRVLREN